MNLASLDRFQGTLIADLGRTKLRVVYSDESESGPLVVIAALIMNMDEHWSNVESHLKKIKAETPKSLLHNGEEFKGSLLYQAIRKREYLRSIGSSIDPDLTKAREVLQAILWVTVKHPTPIYYGAVDKVGYDDHVRLSARSSRRQPSPTNMTGGAKIETTAHDVAFDSCLARVDAFAQAALPRNEQVLWIHDHRGSAQQENETKTGLHWARFLAQQDFDPISLYQAYGNQEPIRVADSVYFGHSHESLALQLADVCCSTISNQLLQKLYGRKQKYAAPYYAIIQRRVMNDGVAPEYMELAKRDEPKDKA
jgi:Protein of unknown function (DUF3800)